MSQVQINMLAFQTRLSHNQGEIIVAEIEVSLGISSDGMVVIPLKVQPCLLSLSCASGMILLRFRFVSHVFCFCFDFVFSF